MRARIAMQSGGKVLILGNFKEIDWNTLDPHEDVYKKTFCTKMCQTTLGLEVDLVFAYFLAENTTFRHPLGNRDHLVQRCLTR